MQSAEREAASLTAGTAPLGFFLRPMVLLEQSPALRRKTLRSRHRFRDRLAPRVRRKRQPRRFAIFLHWPTRMRKVAGEKRTLSLHLVWCVGRPLHTRAKMRPIFLVKRFAAGRCKTAPGVFQRGFLTSRLRGRFLRCTHTPIGEQPSRPRCPPAPCPCSRIKPGTKNQRGNAAHATFPRGKLGTAYDSRRTQ